MKSKLYCREVKTCGSCPNSFHDKGEHGYERGFYCTKVIKPSGNWTFVKDGAVFPDWCPLPDYAEHGGEG